jgi:heme/copper-type cytochrome/quinol oxidase subunit 2
LFLKKYFGGDSAVMYQLGFQYPVIIITERLNLFNLHLLFIIIAIVFLVGWLLFSILSNFTELNNSNLAKFTYSNSIKIIWTSIPALFY